ncbi:MAG TPA: PaaI family thioesterase [Victivallales bacterium]|nr:PaaI family thioesterase [Victivallales bacterium]
MLINTHKQINTNLCGTPLIVEKNYCRIELKTTNEMSSDKYGLVHGGFIFGAADYAAMLAVNHPNVVLGSSTVKFLKPVKVDEIVTIDAKIKEVNNKKNVVYVRAKVCSVDVFEGEFTCFILDKHILA